jgi:hypothetical protein
LLILARLDAFFNAYRTGEFGWQQVAMSRYIFVAANVKNSSPMECWRLENEYSTCCWYGIEMDGYTSLAVDYNFAMVHGIE